MSTRTTSLMLQLLSVLVPAAVSGQCTSDTCRGRSSSDTADQLASIRHELNQVSDVVQSLVQQVDTLKTQVQNIKSSTGIDATPTYGGGFFSHSVKFSVNIYHIQ